MRRHKQTTKMAIIQCPGCGNPVSDQAIHCPKCGQPIQNANVYHQAPAQQIDNSSLEWYMWIVLLFFGWIVDLIYYLVKKDKAPQRAKGALICLAINIVFTIIWACISFAIADAALEEVYYGDYYYY